MPCFSDVTSANSTLKRNGGYIEYCSGVIIGGEGEAWCCEDKRFFPQFEIDVDDANVIADSPV